MQSGEIYDVAIVGGGLAGLSLAILLTRQNYKVILFEKEKYPFHRVCGEYISLESWDFLKGLGIALDQLQLPAIRNLQVSSPNGNLLKHRLPLGGFGISRYLLDSTLARLASAAGAGIAEDCKVTDVFLTGDTFVVETAAGPYRARLVCGSYGKRSNLDVKWKRAFTLAAKSRLNNYIGVKYHIKTDFPADTIALHTFKNGYCGIVKIEDDTYNLCYLTTAGNLQQCGNSLAKMERSILMKNPHLERIFSKSRFLFDAPLAIAQVSFDKKSQAHQHVLMAGDAAGMITPLCGNGMSMALHGSKIAAELIPLYFHGKISLPGLESAYHRNWQKTFSRRLWMGRRIQQLFGNPMLVNGMIRIGKAFPAIVDPLIRRTHGTPF